MSETPPEGALPDQDELPLRTVDEASRWLGEAHEELAVADVLVGNEQLPARAACFHAHLAAEKALKALLLKREVTLKRSHDLALLAGMLDADDAGLLDFDDLAELNPWTIEAAIPLTSLTALHPTSTPC
jgi:HEPN domain-containing protein